MGLPLVGIMCTERFEGMLDLQTKRDEETSEKREGKKRSSSRSARWALKGMHECSISAVERKIR